jgi:hypothetical protein
LIQGDQSAGLDQDGVAVVRVDFQGRLECFQGGLGVLCLIELARRIDPIADIPLAQPLFSFPPALFRPQLRP